MNKNLIKVWALGSLLVATACSKSANEVITEDPSYKIGANEVYVDKPAKFVYGTDNFARSESLSDISLTFTVDGSSVTLEGSDLSFNIKLRRPLSKAMNVTLVQDNTLLSKYTGKKNGLQNLPEGALSGELTFTIPAGVTSHTITLNKDKVSLNNVAQLTNEKGYIGAFKLMASEGSEAKVSESSQAIYVKLVQFIPKMKVIKQKESSWTELSSLSDFTFQSGDTPLLSFSLTDGDDSTAEEVQEGADISIVSSSDNKISVAGIELHFTNDTDIQSFNVLAFYDGDKVDELGPVVVPTSTKSVIVKFTKLIKTFQISLHSFIGSQSNPVKISEIKVFTPAK